MYDLTIADVATYIRQRYEDAVSYMHSLQDAGWDPESRFYRSAKERVYVFDSILTELDMWG